MDLFNSKKNIIFTFLFIIFCWFVTINSMRLLKNDEGRYAEIPREMLESGDFVTPRLNSIKYFEKPPLQYWTTAIFFYVFGEKEWVSRLWTVLTGALTFIALFFYTHYTRGQTQALIVSCILASSPLFIAIGHINVLDMGLTFFLTLSLLSLLELIQEPISKKRKFYANLVFWISISFSLLSKGLISFLLPAMVAFFYTIIKKDFRYLKNISWLWGIPLFLAISAPWFILVSKRNPEFAHFFFIHEHFERFLSKGHGRQGPIWYFIPLVLFGFFPWITYFTSKPPLSKSSTENDNRKRLFLLIWCISIFVFFSISSSKLPHYILPIFPALAILVAERLELSNLTAKRLVISNLIFSIIGIIAFFVLQNKKSDFIQATHYQDLGRSVLYCSIIFFALNTFLLVKLKSFSKNSTIVLAGIFNLIFFQGLYYSYKTLEPSVTGYGAAASIIPHLKNDTLVYTVGDYEQSIPFYIKRKLILVNYIGELRFGIANENIHHHPTMTSFFQEWPNVKNAIIIIDQNNLQQIEPIISSVTKIYEDNQRMVFLKNL